MVKDKYRQDIYFGGLLGALFGIADGIIVNFMYYNQLNNVFLKVVYIIHSLNFHAVLGVILGFVFAVITSLLRLEKSKAVLVKFMLLSFLLIYFGFYTNIFLWNFNHEIFDYLFKLPNLIDEIILLPLMAWTTYLLYRLYQKLPDLVGVRWRGLSFVFTGALFLNVIIWLFLGGGRMSEDAYASDIRPVHVGGRQKNDFSLPPDFIRPRNLLIIVVDTLRADHLGCYGYPKDTSPFIDRFSSYGVLFENAIAQKPKTSPSIASLFTSLYVQDHGVAGVNTILPDKYFTLAESYLKHNFVTQAFVANGSVSAEFNFDQGFMGCILTGDEGIYPQTAKWLEKNKEDPFFLYLHFIAPHTPYNPPREFDVFPPDIKNSPIIGPGSISRRSYLSGHQELDYYVSKYDGEVRYADSLVEKVIGELDRLDLKKNTLIILTSDHGESLGEHGYFFRHGLFPYDTTARVPFIISYGDFPAKRVKRSIELIDVFPTVHEMMGLSYNIDDIKGRSFLPLLYGGVYSDKAFLESGDYSKVSRFYAIRGERWKLIYNAWLPTAEQLFSFDYISNMYRKQWLAFYAGLYPQRDIYELYDLQKDPQETKNLYRPDSKIASLLIEELNEKIGGMDRAFIPQVPAKDMSQRIKGHLRALGYL